MPTLRVLALCSHVFLQLGKPLGQYYNGRKKDKITPLPQVRAPNITMAEKRIRSLPSLKSERVTCRVCKPQTMADMSMYVSAVHGRSGALHATRVHKTHAQVSFQR